MYNLEAIYQVCSIIIGFGGLIIGGMSLSRAIKKDKKTYKKKY